jgi:hypothetical protein
VQAGEDVRHGRDSTPRLAESATERGRFRGDDPELVHDFLRQLARLLVPMEAAEVRSEYVEGGVVDVGNEGDSTSARPARDEEPGSSHDTTP